ncbi:MAG: SpoIIIAH-like family protein [Corallococcus sp.]|nr:SpoIIIAH-like family protein [Corallococcus sp.]MCM1359709.1 SpoIIIAH-like family protein [Corallococcus sp.]MCM1395418.1 SpoIIIAH-like family protein [Corallococcus sp.]
MSKGKKIALMVSMVLVLVVAAVLNVTLLTRKTDDGNNDNDSVQTGFFATSRADRQATRNYEIAELNNILAMEGDEYAEARKKALEQKQNIVSAMETEMLLETLLKAQGFEDCLVTVNSASDNISVIVDRDELTRQDTVKIYNIIATEANVSHEYVKILSV